MKHVYIGDIHGNHEALTGLLMSLGIYKEKGSINWNNPEGYKIVQLGDLNDYEVDLDHRSSIGTIKIMRELQEDIGAVILYSNHLDKFKRWLQGNKVTPSHGLNNTINEFNYLLDGLTTDLIDTAKESLAKWINSLPLFYECVEDNNTYISAHAYFDDRVYSMICNDPHWDEKPKDRDWFKSQCIYGKQKGGERYIWWKDKEYIKEKFNNNYYIFGHYHTEEYGNRFSIIDNEDYLVAYIPSENRSVRVSKYEYRKEIKNEKRSN